MPKKKHQLPKLLTIKQAAEILNVHSETLRRWDKRGKLKAIIVNERGDRRYDPKDIEAILNNKKINMNRQTPKCIYCSSQEPNSFKKKAHILSQFMGNFQPDLFFQGDVVCDQCNSKLGETIEKHFAEKSFEGLIARLLLIRKTGKQSPVILYDSSLLKFHFSPETTIEYNPLLLLVKSALDKVGFTKDPILLLKKGNLHALIFAEEVANIKSQNKIKKLQYKIRSFREGTESADWIGDRDDSSEIVQAALKNLGLKSGSSKETVNDDEQPKQIKSSFIASQDVDVNTARFVAKVALEYFTYCADKSGVLSNVFSGNLKPIRNFIREGTGNAEDFVSVGDNSFVAQKVKQGNNHYFVAFEVLKGNLIGRVAFMDTIAYQVNLGKSPLSLANNKIGNGHAFNLTDKKMKKMYVGKTPVLSGSEFSVYNKG